MDRVIPLGITKVKQLWSHSWATGPVSGRFDRAAYRLGDIDAQGEEEE
jgi:hypothetical protein